MTSIRTAVEKYLRALSVVREQQEAESYARLLLRAHFTEDRNEFLTDDAIRTIGQNATCHRRWQNAVTRSQA